MVVVVVGVKSVVVVVGAFVVDVTLEGFTGVSVVVVVGTEHQSQRPS